jgi:hypothetical protein
MLVRAARSAWLLSLVFAAVPAFGAVVWTPPPGTTWQWQITGVVDESLDVEMYDIDLFDAAPAGIEIGKGRASSRRRARTPA